MILIDGKKAAAELRNELKDEVSELKNKYNKQKIPEKKVNFKIGGFERKKIIYLLKK